MKGTKVDFIPKMKKILNVWHVKLSLDHNICLIQEFYNIYIYTKCDSHPLGTISCMNIAQLE